MDTEHIVSTKSEAREELNRLLEISRLFALVLAPEEVEQLHVLIGRKVNETASFGLSSILKIGNTSVT